MMGLAARAGARRSRQRHRLIRPDSGVASTDPGGIMRAVLASLQPMLAANGTARVPRRRGRWSPVSTGGRSSTWGTVRSCQAAVPPALIAQPCGVRGRWVGCGQTQTVRRVGRSCLSSVLRGVFKSPDELNHRDIANHFEQDQGDVNPQRAECLGASHDTDRPHIGACHDDRIRQRGRVPPGTTTQCYDHSGRPNCTDKYGKPT